MFVSDSTLNFMGIKFQLISTEGYSWETACDPSATVDSLKRLAIQYFYPDEDSVTPEQFRVIYPAEHRTLSDHHALHEEGVKDNEILLFVRRRMNGAANVTTATTAPPKSISKDPASNESEWKAPTAQEIIAATKDLPVHTRPQTPVSSPQRPNHHQNNQHSIFHQDDLDFPESAVDFQLELRKIIISLVSVMATLLHGNEDADLICREMFTRIKNRLNAVSSKRVEGTQFIYPPPPEIPCSPQGIVQGLVEVKKREFRPNLKALENLREMGFKDEQIIQALRANKNGKDAACEWLIAGKGAGEPLEIDDLRGLNRESHLFTALVNAPPIRLGLYSPKTLLAFLNILESPASANIWLSDMDTAPVLSTIFKIYHAEKHAEPSPSSPS